MRYEVEILEVDHGYAYKVYAIRESFDKETTPLRGPFYQENDPELSGYVPMNRERAEQCANQLIQKLIQLDREGV